MRGGRNGLPRLGDRRRLEGRSSRSANPGGAAIRVRRPSASGTLGRLAQDERRPHELRRRCAVASVHGPVGLRLDANGVGRGTKPGAPLLVTEFGGVAYAGEGTWGYLVVGSDDEFASRVGALFDALRASSVVAGYCYTQLTDTFQESNGLLTADRRPKLPIERLRAIVLGEDRPPR